MRALVIYESMYGNTRRIAEVIADGIGLGPDVAVLPVAEAQAALAEHKDVELVVIGGPTHARGMSRPSTREAAVTNSSSYGRDLVIDPHAYGLGVRELLEEIGPLTCRAAAFDTRLRAPAWVFGRASRGIARRLADRGAELIAPPESFLVTKRGHLVPGEVERARRWGTVLGKAGVEGVDRARGTSA
jgi:hypothetical protein